MGKEILLAAVVMICAAPVVDIDPTLSRLNWAGARELCDMICNENISVKIIHMAEMTKL